jgi:hypothetical protein
MAQLNPNQYLKLGNGSPVYGQSTGLYWDRTNSQLCLAIDGVIVDTITASGSTADLQFSSEARGDIIRRGATVWERHVGKTTGQIISGDGTDVISAPVTGDVGLAASGGNLVSTVVNVTQASQAAGDLLYKATASTLTRLAKGPAGQALVSDGSVPSWSKLTSANIDADAVATDFTQQREVPIFAKTTGAIKTAANAQQDFFWVGSPPQYFELAQGVGALGANTLLAANGLTPSTTGWLLTLDNTATDSLEITQGIVLGSARSFVTGTSAAFTLKCAFLVPTRANITHLLMGFRKLGAYVTASTLAEAQTAYDDKAMFGIKDNAGVLSTETSLATVDVSTALAHAAAVDGDILALQVLVSAAGVTTYKLATATPAGSTAAQTQAAVTTAYAALATDASAVAYTFGAATVVVPSIIIGASGASAPDVKLVNYFCGLQ